MACGGDEVGFAVCMNKVELREIGRSTALDGMSPRSCQRIGIHVMSSLLWPDSICVEAAIAVVEMRNPRYRKEGRRGLGQCFGAVSILQ